MKYFRLTSALTFSFLFLLFLFTPSYRLFAEEKKIVRYPSSKIEMLTHIKKISAHIKKDWQPLPEHAGLKATVALEQNEAGQIINTDVVISSGNDEYDNLCLKTVQNASPLPLSPEHLFEQHFKKIRLLFDGNQN